MCSDHYNICIRIVISLICIGLALNLYLNNRASHPYCLWEGAHVMGTYDNGSYTNIEACQYDNCDITLCNMINKKGMLDVTIEKDYILNTQPNFTYIDSLWILLLILLSVIPIIDIISLIRTKYSNKIDIDYYEYS